jgi:hypothetical protein
MAKCRGANFGMGDIQYARGFETTAALAGKPIPAEREIAIAVA